MTGSKFKIDLLLPVKEAFSPANAGAVATIVHDLVTESSSEDDVRVVGRTIEAPFEGVNFCGLKPKMAWLFGKNDGFMAAYLDQLKTHPAPDLIEVHGRCHVASQLIKKRPDIPVSLYLHNDPRTMKGAKTVGEREWLLNGLIQIICVSDYIRRCFLEGLDNDNALIAKVNVVPNGVSRRLKSPAKKEPLIFLAGRMVPEKGILECAQALADILPSFPEWRLVIAGGRRFEQAEAGSYEAKVARALSPLGDQVEMTGFIPIDAVRGWQERAAIAACPSLWEEPLGKVVVEAIAAGCAVLTTRRGGIPEVAEGRALIIDKPSVSSLRVGFEQLLSDDKLRLDLQTKAWANFPFTSTAMANKVVALRHMAINAALHGHRV
ncbi:MAG: glycosyltransferase family 4 protein [Candidatus Puniceispirillum sp.]|nr:glycosyltransferase family 4 protein [Candidatus Puniceispirillum sp.]